MTRAALAACAWIPAFAGMTRAAPGPAPFVACS
jgi:hypothetical protein